MPRLKLPRLKLPRPHLKARYSYVALALLMLIFAGSNLVFTAHEVGNSNRKWCGLVTTIDRADTSAPKKPSAGTFTSQFITDIHMLKDSLGC